MGASSTTLNLSDASVLLVDANRVGLNILTQLFAGFGVGNPRRCDTYEAAVDVLREISFDLIVSEASLGDEDAFNLVRWLRRSGLEANCMTPFIVTTGHTPKRDVLRARDCGANFLIAKPLSPRVLLDRVLWLAKDSRNYVETGTYSGPDRRWHSVGPPRDQTPRRASDLTGNIGEAVGPNLDQADIDALFKPQRVSL